MEGYDFEIAGDDLHDYKCPICLLLLRQALLMPCSHSACKECLLKWEQQADTGDFRCPSCNRIYEREKVHAGEEGKFIDRLVTTSLKIKCKQHLKDCNWVGTISNYEIHEKTCTQQPVACQFPGCDVTVVRKDLPRHQKICGYRIVECEYCTKMIQFNQLEQHYGICDYCDVTCQQGCGRIFKRKEKPTHTAQECPNTEISCPYQKMSCTQKIMRKDLADHMNSFAQQHSILLLQHTLELSNEVRDLKDSNEVLQVEMQEHKESTSMRISHLEGKLEEKENEIHVLNYELVNIKNQLKQGCQKNSEDLETISEKISILDTKLQVNEKKHNEDILLTKNEKEEFKEIAVAISQLSNEDRSKNWSFVELRYLIERIENCRFIGIINLHPELALLRRSTCGEESLLHCACRYNNVACIDILLKNGCDVNCENAFGMRPIHVTAIYGSIDTAEKLLSFDETLLNSINNSTKYSPLHYAAFNKKEDLVKYLLIQPGIRVNLRDGDNKMADEYNIRCPEYKRIQKKIREYRDNHL